MRQIRLLEWEKVHKLEKIRESCQEIYDDCKHRRSEHFEIHEENIDKVVDYIIHIMKREYPSLNDIPIHGRWQHFQVGGRDRIGALISSLKDDNKKSSTEIARSIVDLIFVSVLLDAGSGKDWKYIEKTGTQSLVHSRSEGLAVASYYLFINGKFSSSTTDKFRVDAKGLASLTLNDLAEGFQVTVENPLVGLQGRFDVLKRLAVALQEDPNYFRLSNSQDQDGPRPGYLVDYLTSNAEPDGALSIRVLWKVLTTSLNRVWPTRSQYQIVETGEFVSLGDVWPLQRNDHLILVSFHKLTQWLCYSLIQPLTTFIPSLYLADAHLLTGLPEYRNGGLLIDFEVLKLKHQPADTTLVFHVEDEVIVEWRALTVILLDKIATGIRNALHVTAEILPLGKILEAGTWKAGREIAFEKRPQLNGCPPISIVSDGTVF